MARGYIFLSETFQTFGKLVTLQSEIMGRILAIDYGKRRCGLAVTDPLRIVATALATVDTPKLPDYLKD